MDNLIPPNIAAGITAAVLGAVFLWLNEIIFFEWHISVILSSLIASPFYFFLAYVFSSILLLPLKWIMKRTPKIFSLILFLTLGFLLTCFLSIISTWISAHGEDPFSEGKQIHTIFTSITFGIIGASSAFSSWVILKKMEETNVT